MNPKTFKPELFIDIGQTGAMFTLRVTYLHTTYIRGEGDMGGAVVNGVYQGQVAHEVRSHHLQNLGQDAAEAHAKAVGFAAERGERLTTTLEELTEKLRTITRRTAEDVRREHAAAMQRVAAQADWWVMENLTFRPKDVFHHGKYQGKTIAEVGALDRGYLEWAAKEPATRERPEWQLRRLMIVQWLESHPAAPVVNGFMGAVGERLQVAGVVTFTRDFPPPAGIYGARGRMLVKLRAESGHVLTTWSSGGFRPEVGDKVRIKGTVKLHTEFRGVCETQLARVAEVAS